MEPIPQFPATPAKIQSLQKNNHQFITGAIRARTTVPAQTRIFFARAQGLKSRDGKVLTEIKVVTPNSVHGACLPAAPLYGDNGQAGTGE